MVGSSAMPLGSQAGGVFLDEPLRQWVNDRDGSTRVLLVGGHGQVEAVRLGIEHRGFNAATGISEDQFAHNSASGDRDERGEWDGLRSVGHDEELILGVEGHLIGSLRAASLQRGDNGARGEVDELDRAVTIGGPQLAEVVHQHASGSLRLAAPVKPTKAADLPNERIGACVDQVDTGITGVGQVVDLALVIDETDIEGPQAMWRNFWPGDERDLPQALRALLRLHLMGTDDVAH